MRRTFALLAALLLALGLASCGDDDDDTSTAAQDDTSSTTATTAAADDATTTTTEADASADAAVAVADSAALGEILVGADGMTLYMFKPDTEEASACTDQCAQAWPPLAADGEPSGGDGVDASLLGTAARDDGSSQVTYNGHRLYHFSGDNAPGDTNGQGVADVWYALTPAGEQAAA